MKRSALADTAVVLASGIVVAAAFSLLFWAMPLADDFCRAGTRIAWPQFVVDRYHAWTGRWLAMGLYAALLPRIDITSAQYTALLALIWGALLLGQYALARLVWGRALPFRVAASSALVLSALFLSGIPSPGESLYWLTGAIEYTLPIVLSILGVASLARASEHPRRHPRSLAWNALGLVSIVAVTGLHEIAGVTLLLILVAIATTTRALGVESAASWRTAVFVAALGCLVTALAPGNTVRLNRHFAGGAVTARRISEVLRIQFEVYLVPWMTDVRLVLASALVLTSSTLSTPPAWAQRGGRVVLAVVPVVAAVSIMTTFLVMALKVGVMGPSRLYSYTYGVFLIGWLVSLVVWSARLRLSAAFAGSGELRLMVAALFVLSVFSAPRVLGYLGDLTGKETVMRYHRETTRIYRSLRDARQAGEHRVSIPALPRFPASFFATGIGKDPANWHNRCVAGFFGLDSVYVGPGGG